MTMDVESSDADCATGNVWLWERLGQCLEDTEQVIGFLIGLLAIFVWSSAHVLLYNFQRRRTKGSRRCSIRLFLVLYWFADFLGCFGAALSAQLSSQLMFGICAVFINTMCCIHTLLIKPAQKAGKKVKALSGKRSSRMLRCLLPLTTFLFPAVTVWTLSSKSSIFKREVSQLLIRSEAYIPAFRIVGYVIGSTGGVLYCCAKTVDIFDAYLTVDCSASVVAVYVTSFCAEIFYVISVFTQDQSVTFFLHTLPWIVPRLTSAGLDVGVLCQRFLQKRHGKRRKLSEEDASCLISSSSGSDADWSSDSEEVIWMPLKCVQSAAPPLPVCEAAIQILSESDGVSDKTGLTDSRRNSEVIQVKERRRLNRGKDLSKTDEDPVNKVSSSDEEDDIQPHISSLDAVTSHEKTTSWITENVPEREVNSAKGGNHSDKTWENEVDEITDEQERVTRITSQGDITLEKGSAEMSKDDRNQEHDSPDEGQLTQNQRPDMTIMKEREITGNHISGETTSVDACSVPEIPTAVVGIKKLTNSVDKIPEKLTSGDTTAKIGKLELKEKVIKNKTLDKTRRNQESPRKAGGSERGKGLNIRRSQPTLSVSKIPLATSARREKADGSEVKDMSAQELQKRLNKVVKRSSSLKSLK